VKHGQWSGGFSGEVRVTAGTAALRGWQVSLTWPDGQRLTEIAKIVDDGKLRPLIQVVLPLAQAKEALELSRSRHAGGKIVLTI